MDTILVMTLGYGVGSLPLGYLLTSRATGIDLRLAGSGNVGAANAHRTAGPSLALLVLLVDVAKGAGSVWLSALVSAGAVAPIVAGVAAIVGHAYPVWLRFHGGKGVAVGAGVFWVLAPAATTISAAIFAITVWGSRYVSLGSVAAVSALPALTWVTSAPPPVVIGSVIAAAFILERHRSNLSRLVGGTERRLGQRT